MQLFENITRPFLSLDIELWMFASDQARRQQQVMSQFAALQF
jgi:hypothetical protein